MPKVSHATMITLSGALWLAIGLMLLRIGVNLLLPPQAESIAVGPVINFLTPLLGGHKLALLSLIALALMVGYLKGRFVLGKAAKKGVERILAFPNPTHLTNLYSPRYLILLGVMVALGFSIKYLGIPHDIRGSIDIAIGIALLTGSLIYFRIAAALR